MSDWKLRLTLTDIGGPHQRLEMYHRGEQILGVTDEIEPEDVLFSRDLGFVVQWVEQAYKFGLRDGKDNCLREQRG